MSNRVVYGILYMVKKEEYKQDKEAVYEKSIFDRA